MAQLETPKPPEQPDVTESTLGRIASRQSVIETRIAQLENQISNLSGQMSHIINLLTEVGERLQAADTVQKFSTPSKKVAKRKIREYIDTHVDCKTSDIIFDLEIDPLLVMETLKELKKEGLVLSKPFEQK